ncbi:MAG: 3-hydroxyisobutyrate dehydrogenase [Hyphomicrobiaceae bacterium]
MATVGFIGLGNMGLPMAGNLIKDGHRVVAYDIEGSRLDAAVERGAVAALSAASATQDADVVITMLPVGRHVLSVYNDGLVAAASTGTLLIDCSTIDVADARQAHEIASQKGLQSLDAPVSGGVGGAEAATLTFMVGGKQTAFSAAKAILGSMGQKVVHCGEAGAGQAAKICNNMIMAVSMIGVAEGFCLAEKLGLSPQALHEVVSTSSGSCWAMTNYCPVPGPVPKSPANNDFKPGFATALMEKDLTLSQNAALTTGASTPMGAEATHLFRLYMSIGGGDKDFSSIIQFIRGMERAP